MRAFDEANSINLQLVAAARTLRPQSCSQKANMVLRREKCLYEQSPDI